MPGAAESMARRDALEANSRDGAVAATYQALCADHNPRGWPWEAWQLCRFVHTSAVAKCNLVLTASQQAWPQRVVGFSPLSTTPSHRWASFLFL